MSKLFRENLHLKVLAFTLTVVLYFFVLSEKETTREFTLEVTVGSVPSEYVVLNDLPDITVSLRGGPRAFARLDNDALRTLVIDVSDPEITRREIREADLDLPPHLTVETIAPRWVNVEIDRLESRSLPVRPIVRGTPARGFEATDPVVTPDHISVSAPSSYFPEFEAVFTEGIDITGENAPVVRNVGLSIQRPYVSYPPGTSIDVAIDITAIYDTRSLTAVPIMLTGPSASRCATDVTSISVTVTGPKTLVEGLDSHDVFASIDCAEYANQGEGVYLHEPSIKNLARGIDVIETVPEVVTLRVEPLPVPPPRPQPQPLRPLEGSGAAPFSP